MLPIGHYKMLESFCSCLSSVYFRRIPNYMAENSQNHSPTIFLVGDRRPEGLSNTGLGGPRVEIEQKLSNDPPGTDLYFVF